MFHMGADAKILAVAAARARRAPSPSRSSLARSIARRDRPRQRRLGRLAAGDLSARAPSGGPRELAQLAQLVQRDGVEPRAALRRAARARRLGEPRPAHAGRLDAGDARGDRGRACAARGVPADAAASRCARSRRARRRPVRARADRRRRAHARAAATSRRRRSSTSCVRGVEAEAARAASTLGPASTATPPRRCAPEQIERVLFNLLTNALRHTPSDGSVAVLVERRDERRHCPRRGHRRAASRPTRARRMFDRFWRERPGAHGRRTGSASRSPAASSRRTAAGSGPRAATGGARVSFTLPVA